MDCRDVDQRIDAFWDRALPADTARQVNLHLLACPSCGERHGRLNELLSAPREHMPVSADLKNRILAEVARQPLPRASRGNGSEREGGVRTFAPAWSGLAAACLMLLVAGGLVWHLAGRQPAIPTADLPTAPAPVAAGPEPDPVLLAGWAHAVVLPAPVSPMILVAHATAMTELSRASTQGTASIQVARRPLREDIPPPERPVPPPELLMPWNRLAL